MFFTKILSQIFQYGVQFEPRLWKCRHIGAPYRSSAGLEYQIELQKFLVLVQNFGILIRFRNLNKCKGTQFDILFMDHKHSISTDRASCISEFFPDWQNVGDETIVMLYSLLYVYDRVLSSNFQLWF